MTARYPLSPDDLVPVAVLGIGTVAYLVFHYAASAARLEPWMRARLGPRAGHAAAWFAQRALGAILLGAIPVALASALLGYTPGALGLGDARWGVTVAIVTIGGAVALVVVRRAATRAALQAMYPQVREARWSATLVAANATTWIVYLAGYEAFFRGFLLVPLVDTLGLWPAIAVNTSLYVTVHLTKHWTEAVGTLVMGVLFAWMALESGAIWAPLGVHVVIAVGTDTFARRSNPTMQPTAAQPTSTDVNRP